MEEPGIPDIDADQFDRARGTAGRSRRLSAT